LTKFILIAGNHSSMDWISMQFQKYMPTGAQRKYYC
jgi:hypothetical protein